MVFDLFDADGLTGEDQTEIDLLTLVADASACCDGDRLVVQSSSVGRRIGTTGDYRGQTTPALDPPKSLARAEVSTPVPTEARNRLCLWPLTIAVSVAVR
jgi:hypothetical protein